MWWTQSRGSSNEEALVIDIYEDDGRFELKFALPAGLRPQIITCLPPCVSADLHADDLGDGRKGYVVRSLYLDTPSLDDYAARLGELRLRHRTRFRTYGATAGTSPVFLENKRKLDDQVVKTRIEIGTSQQWMDLSDRARPWEALVPHLKGRSRLVAQRLCKLLEQEDRQTVSSVLYQREVFVDTRPGCEKVRLTIDSHVQGAARPTWAGLLGDAEFALLPDDWVVLELKFGQVQPGWMRALERKLKLVSEPVSKFGLSVARGIRAGHPRDLRYLTPRSILRSVA
jgi:hypothetical protein